MNTSKKSSIRSIAKTYLSERPEKARSKAPLPADYDAFHQEMGGKAADREIRLFQEEWYDVYEEMQ